MPKDCPRLLFSDLKPWSFIGFADSPLTFWGRNATLLSSFAEVHCALKRRREANDDEERGKSHQMRRRKGNIRSLCANAFLSSVSEWQQPLPAA